MALSKRLARKSVTPGEELVSRQLNYETMRIKARIYIRIPIQRGPLEEQPGIKNKIKDFPWRTIQRLDVELLLKR